MTSQGDIANEGGTDGEERFRALFQYSPDVIMVFDRDGVITDVNAAVARMGTVSRERMIGRHFGYLATPEERDRNQQYFDRVMAGETCFYETFARRRDERPLSVSLTVVPLYSGAAVTGAFAIVRDVTFERDAARRIREQGRALIESDRRLRSLFASFPDGVVAVDTHGVITEVNDASLQMGDFPRERVIGAHFHDFTLSSERDAVSARFERALAGETLNFDMRSVRVDGAPLDLSTTLIPQREGEGVVGVYAIVQDVTDRRAAERRAASAAQRLRDLYDIAASSEYSQARLHATLELGCGAFGLDAGAIVECGPDTSMESRYAVPDRESVDDEALFGLARRAMDDPSPNAIVLERNGLGIKIVVNDEPFGAIVFATANERTATFEETDADLLGLIATLLGSAIDRRRSRAHLRALAYYDTLTGLPNRVSIHERLREALEVAQSRLERVAVLVLDLDRFKDVNETLGHGRGDLLLTLVAERLKREMWQRSTVARMGGDEFALIVPDCGELENVRDIADRVLQILGEPFALDEYEQFVSASIGIAIYPEHGSDDQTLVKNADIAMYRAKDRGRNTAYVYNSSLEAPIHMRLSQERLLRRALDVGEFEVYYQPLIDLRTGTIVSVEALVRWNHPKSGLIEPAHFIPSAEISGLIVPLGDWVLSTAAKQVRTWQGDLGPLRLAVNLSPKQFHQRDLRARILSSLADADLDPHSLELEITESAAMSDADSTVAIVRDLKNAGIRFAVDDFGTGYSSLGYLRRFDIDVLKIDRSFTSGIGVQPSDETIVRTVLAMAHSLGLEVVAEGVETEAQLAFLRQHECDLVQGHVVAPALPAEKLERLLRQRRGAATSAG
jgi:diguanylate cyclase (GGDEF)-like protein/PAS domain S-box-containing protein